MKTNLASAVRRARDIVANATGIRLGSVRGHKGSHVGLELLWSRFDNRIERCAISHVFDFDTVCSFLVRDIADYIQRHHYEGRFYSREELMLIRDHYKGGTFVDIGANVGNHSIFAAKVMRAPNVIAIEPNPAAYKILNCNLALNELGNVVRHIACGLSDHEGVAAVEKIGEANLGGAQLREGDGGAVLLRRGDELLSDVDVGFIKIDVEGMELGVLRGLEQTIRRSRPSILVEVDEPHRSEFEAVCHGLGYRLAAEIRAYEANSNHLIVPIP